MWKTKIFNFLRYGLIGFVGLNVFTTVYFVRLSFDDSFNLQVAKSLADRFIYQSTYFPRFIYDSRLTTNGVMQYFTSLNFYLFGERIGLSIALAIIAIITLWFLSRFSLRVFFGAVFLLLVYPFFNESMLRFLGEFFALGFVMGGSYYVRRQVSSIADGHKVFLNAILASLCFGLAVSTKFIVAPFLPFILFGLYFETTSIKKTFFLEALKNTTQVLLMSFSVFILLYYISVFHSQIVLMIFGDPAQDFPVSSLGIVEFVRHHFWQESVQQPVEMFRIKSFSQVWVLPLFLSSLLVLCFFSVGWVPMAVVLFWILLQGHLNERRMFLFVVPTFFFACDCVLKEIGHSLKEKKKLVALGFAAPSILFLCVCTYALYDCFYKYPSETKMYPNLKYCSQYSLLFPTLDSALKQVSEADKNENVFIGTDGLREIAQVIQKENVPVIASGWWQCPDLQLLSKRSFYDRMQPSVSDYLKGKKMILVFDSKNICWPETSKEMCTEILIDTPNLTLCYYDSRYPLNFRWGIESLDLLGERDR